MYDSLAKFYDEFTDDVDYEKWTEDLLVKINKYSKTKVNNIIDVACGTGNITCRLAKKGYKVLGIDISQEMLEYAYERMHKIGVRCNFLCQDMREIAVSKQFDCIICTCDGVNYLLEDKDFFKFIDSAKEALIDGGLLIFDISSEDKLKNKLGNNSYFDIREDSCVFWQNELLDDKIKLDLTMFIEEEDGLYARYDETQIQRIYKEEDILKLIKGFKVLDVSYVCYNDEKNDKRIQFVCVKE